MTFLLRRRLAIAIVALLSLVATYLVVRAKEAAATTPTFTYAHDDAGRLVAVIDPLTEAAVYHYDAVGNITSITRQSSSALSVIEFTPRTQFVGSKVTIYGTSFSATPSANTVRFGTAVATVNTASSTQLVVTVPTAPVNGPISVTVGANTANSTASFTQRLKPTFASFTPTSGITGNSVTITGANFESLKTDNVVAFNGTRAVVTAATPTSLTVEVPPGATSGKITVYTPNGKVTNSQDFIVPQGGYQANQVSATTRMSPGEAKTFTIPSGVGEALFDAAAGQRVSISTSSTFPGAVSVYDLDGTTLATTSCTTCWVMDATTLHVAGTYTILIAPGTGTSGTVTVTLNDVPADASAAATVGGGSVNATTTIPGQNAAITFAGTAGQKVSVQTSSTAGTWAGTLLDPDGAALTSQSACSCSNWVIDARILPQTGTYTIRFDPSGPGVGTQTAQVYAVPADATATATEGGSAANVTTTIPGQNASITFNASANDRVAIQTSSAWTGWGAMVFAPDSSLIAAKDTCSGCTWFMDTVSLPQSGTYTLYLDPAGDTTGTATTQVYSVPPDASASTTIDGSAGNATVTTPGQNANVTFAGSAAQQVTITASSSFTGSGALIGPDGSQLSSTGCISCGWSFTITLPQTGTYSIFFNPAGTATGTGTASVASAGGGGGGGASPQMQAASTSIWSISASSANPKPSPSSSPTSSPTPSPSPSGPTPTPSPSGETPTPSPTPSPTASGRSPAPSPQSAPTPPPTKQAAASPSPKDSGPPPVLVGKPGSTAVSGRVITSDGQPLAGVILSIGKASARSDKYGRFLLTKLTAGFASLVIDGTKVGKINYGQYRVGITVLAKQTNLLPWTSYLTKLDIAHAVSITSPTTSEVVVTNPAMPGVELHIPKGSTVTDEAGKPVTSISITPIPAARPPFPTPANVPVPLYYTIQPGGMHVSAPGAYLVYPNPGYIGVGPGGRVDFWHYDPNSDRGWYVYGQGTVTADGRLVIPDPDTRLTYFTASMISRPRIGGKNRGKKRRGNEGRGDPIDLNTGAQTIQHTDLYLPDVIPIQAGRSMRSTDPVAREFGIGGSQDYDMYLVSPNPYQTAILVLPDGSEVSYDRLSVGNAFGDAVFEASGTPGAFYKSRIAWNGDGWDLTLHDGTVFVFGQYAPLQAIRDRFGNKVSIVRSGGQSGNIAYVRSPSGRWLQFHYDSSNRIDWIKDNIGREVDYQYDGSGRVWKVTDPKGGVTEYTYNSSNQLLTAKTPRGKVFITNEYDPATGRVTKQTDATGGVWQFAYTTDANGSVIQTDVTDPRGIVERVSFNSDGDKTSDVEALGKPEQRTWTHEYQSGTTFLTKVTDPLGRQTKLAYDAFGNMKAITLAYGTPDAVTSSFAYEPKYGRLTKVTDSLLHATTIAYPSLTRTVVTNPLGKDTTIDFDIAGQVSQITNALNQSTTISNDLGDPVVVTDALGNTVSYFVDGGGRTAAVTAATGVTVRKTYDVLNDLANVRDPLGQETGLSYDADGNLTSFTDARLRSTSYSYDPMDRLASRTDALSRVQSYGYDAAGSPTRITDRRGKVTTIGYDNLGRRNFVGFGTVGSGQSTTYESTISYTIDAADRLRQAVDSVAGTIALDYDTLDCLTMQTTSQGSVSYACDEAGRREAMTVAGQPQVSYSYDNANSLRSITKGNSVVSIAYDDAGRRDTLTLPNGVVTAYGFDDASRLRSLTYTKGGALGDLAYDYDAAGVRAGVSGSFARVALPAPVSSATYDDANQLTSWGGTTLGYDQAGNLTGDGSNSYTWNARDQLASISGPTPASFTYDAFGRRQTKTYGGASTGFLYDRANVVQELAGGAPSASLLSGGLDEVFTRTEGATSASFLTDGLGSTLALTDGTGAITTSYAYEPFGKATLAGAPSTNPYQFTGREADASGLNYFRARYQSPATGRFLSEDPLDFAGGGPNLYSYVANSPVNLTDPFGTNILGDAWSGLKSLASEAKSAFQDAWSWIQDRAGEFANGIRAIGQYISDHKVAIGVILAVISVLAGGAGLVAFAMEAGTISQLLGFIALTTGLGAAALDYGECRAGNQVACVAAYLGAVGAIAGAPMLAADLIGVSAVSQLGTALGALAFGGLLFGGIALVIDIVRGIVGVTVQMP